MLFRQSSAPRAKTGINPFNFYGANEDVFKLTLTRSDNPHDNHEGLSTELLDPIPRNPMSFIWLKPYRTTGVPEGVAAETGKAIEYGLSAGFDVDIQFEFGQGQQYDTQVDGLLVCEVSLHNSIVIVDDVATVPKHGVMLTRFRVDVPRANKGKNRHRQTIKPFATPDGQLIKDHILSFALTGNNRNRHLLFEFFAPDEVTGNWVPVYSAAYDVNYRYISLADETYFKKVGDVGTTQSERRVAVQTAMTRGETVAIISTQPLYQRRLPTMWTPTPDERRARAEFLAGEAKR